MTIDRAYYGLACLSILLFMVWVGTDLFPIFIASTISLAACSILLMISETRLMKERSRSTQQNIDEYTLVCEIEMFLLDNDLAKQGGFRCPDCNSISWNPNDLREGYCGRCHAFTGPKRPDGPEIDP